MKKFKEKIENKGNWYSFGYVPDYKYNRCLDLFLKIIGLPIIFRRIEARHMMRMLKNSEYGHILDIGAGDGIFELELAKRSYNICGIDIDRKKLLLAKERIERMEYKGINLILADAGHIPFKEDSFVSCICNCTLEHIKNDEQVIKQAHNLLKKGGLFILSVPHHYNRPIIPIISFWLSMPIKIRKILAPKYLWDKENMSYKEALWHLKRDKFKEQRNYTNKLLFNMVEKNGFIVCDWNYVWKFFGAVLLDLMAGIKWIHYNKGMAILFPIMYPIAILDELLPKNFEGREIIVKLKKK